MYSNEPDPHLKFPEEFNALKCFHRHWSSNSPPTTLAITKAGGIYSDQNLVNLRDHSTCSTLSEVPQANNMPKMSSGSYANPRREILRPNPKTHSNSEERTPSPFSLQHLQLPALSLAPTGYRSIARFRIIKMAMPATISPHSKYPHIPMGMFMDGGEFLGMLIPTM